VMQDSDGTFSLSHISVQKYPLDNRMLAFGLKFSVTAMHAYPKAAV
jgi:hypothetical protein